MPRAPAVRGKRPLFDRPAVRGFTGLLLAACIGVAAIAWQSSYGDSAKEMIARWVPQRVVSSSPPLENPGLPTQPSPPPVQAARGADSTSTTSTSGSDRTGRRRPRPPPPLSPELTQFAPVDGARSLATLGQAIEQLKASQARMARDNANAAEQLKASQETNGPRHCQSFRGQGFRSQGLRAETQDISASAAADCYPDAQARCRRPDDPRRWPSHRAWPSRPPSTIPNAFVWSALTVARFTMI